MSVFNLYSRYYNLLYSEKDYCGEAQYILEELKKNQPHLKTVLNIGCGTGRHDFLLAQAGLKMTCIDRSAEMLEVAQTQLKTEESLIQKNIRFLKKDAESFQLDETFDAITSLFHVVSYLTKNSQLQSMFENVSKHLKVGGIFFFDVWYGPAVLTQKPESRVKQTEDEFIQVSRLATPKIDFSRNIVDVNYAITLTNKADLKIETLNETHSMRYFFLPEIELLLTAAGLTLISSAEWKTRKVLGPETWSACFVAQKKTDGI